MKELLYLKNFSEYLKNKDAELFEKVSPLGVIRHSNESEIEIFSEVAFGEFYNQEDWDKVVAYQNQYNDPSRR